MAQALRNLIRNAIEHTVAPSGLVRLEVTSRPGGVVRFVVLDDGPGIAPDELESVFERFHRTDGDRSRTTGGAGLGLAIVRAIARAHDGDARAVSNATGARLELELPRLRLHQPEGDSGGAAAEDLAPAAADIARRDASSPAGVDLVRASVPRSPGAGGAESSPAR